ncbi:hypothetical protein BOTBODRAFT_31890 [Botryobasidium botryosum FD-172 SS1]|uniref:Dipeptidase n=1 Tax=Botryobasidium botryosum (strain FD-172 SS1) TaxID=930990 RepID=A0A067MI52_BOTB1|nr:hypothetical protein BOTBODRAFT_31890 [Botryobasidium botryosum FD-172 SS1]
MATARETQPLLRNGNGTHPVPANDDDPSELADPPIVSTRQLTLAGVLTFAFILTGALLFHFVPDHTPLRFPRDPERAALEILERTPVIDGHIDLPGLVRWTYRDDIHTFDLHGRMPGDVDIPRLRAGKAGAFFWSVWVDCPAGAGYDEGVNFTKPSYRVRDTLEQIDVTRLLIDKYSDTFELAHGVNEVKDAIYRGKIAGLIGVEGGHQLGNSLGVLRTYYSLGVRYMTLTHSCSNAFADSAGIFETPPPVHGGLSPLGKTLIGEMNRLGMLVDLSHTADTTAIQALRVSEAPVIWSHSSARGVWDVPRNVPDEILEMIGEGKGKKDAVVMVNFAPGFVAAPGNATVAAVADHVDHIARVAGKRHVGIGSDYDGIGSTPEGLEDVSKYPKLFAELYRRGWNAEELGGLAGGNFLRVFKGAEEVAERLRGEGVKPAMDIYEHRTDL